MTLHLVEVDDARAYGCVPTDAEGRVTAFLEKMPDPVTRWINAGAYVFRRSVIDAIPVGQVVSVERETFPQLLAEGRDVRAWKQTAYWCDVGTPEALIRCSADVVNGVAPRVPCHRRSRARVAPDADRRAGRAVIDGGSSVASGADIGSGSRRSTRRSSCRAPASAPVPGSRPASSVRGRRWGRVPWSSTWCWPTVRR